MSQKIKYLGIDGILPFFKWMFKNDLEQFEKELADYIGIKYAIGTSYGRTALYLGLKAIDVRGKEVLLPAFTCTVVRQAVLLAGAIPRFVDIKQNIFDFDLEDLARKISATTRAVIITHYFGTVSQNMDSVINICRKNGIIIIEDCAHSFGAEHQGRKIGSYSDFGIFSLTKGLVNFGGGMLVTDDLNIYKEAKKIIACQRSGLKRRVSDFPLVLTYGLEQMIDKFSTDRIGKRILSYLIPKIIATIKALRYYSIFIIKSFLRFPNSKNHPKPEYTGNNQTEFNNLDYMEMDTNPYPIEMNRIIASLGRNQLKKIERFILARKQIFTDIVNKVPNAIIIRNNNQDRYIYTNILFKFSPNQISYVMAESKKRGLSLRGTWPTHQRLWDEQKTESVYKIKDEILIWNINPAFTSTEQTALIEIINEINQNL